MPGQRLAFTWQLAAEQLHTQGAVPPADLGVNADVLGFDRRGEGAGGWSVVIDIPSENLWWRIEQKQTGGGRGEGRLVWRECDSRFVHVLCDQSMFSQFMLFKVSKQGSQQPEALWIQSLALCVWEEQRAAKRTRNAPQMNKRLHVITQLGPNVQCCSFWGDLSKVALSLAKWRTAVVGRLSGMMECLVSCLVAVHSQKV